MSATDLLTAVSILLAAGAILLAWHADRVQRAKEYTDRIRTAASITLSKVDRCEALFLSFYDLFEPYLPELDALFESTKEAKPCRLLLWRRLHEINTAVFAMFNDEEIELAYAPLFGFQIAIYGLFKSAISAAREAYRDNFNVFLGRSQAIVLELEGTKSEPRALLSNLLRSEAARSENILSAHLSDSLSELREVLKATVLLDDREIRQRDAMSKILQTLQANTQVR